MSENDNTDQIAEWNGAQGERWATMQREIDGIVLPFGHAALKAAAPQAGEIGLERESYGLNTTAGTDGRPMVIIRDYTGRGDIDSPLRNHAA